MDLQKYSIVKTDVEAIELTKENINSIANELDTSYEKLNAGRLLTVLANHRVLVLRPGCFLVKHPDGFYECISKYSFNKKYKIKEN